MNWLLRKLPIIAALFAFIAAFAWLDQDKQFRRDNFNAYSLHNTSDSGCSLAFRFMKERRAASTSTSPGAKGAELNRAIELANLEPHAVVFRFGPQVIPGEHEDRNAVHDSETKDSKDSKDPKNTDPKKKVKTREKKKLPLLTPGETQWLESGGRLVLAIENKYNTLESQRLVASSEVKKVFPIWPSISKVEAASARMLAGEGLAESHTLLALGGDVYAARIPVGKGEVIAFAAPDLFSNGFLAKGDNLRFLTELAEPNRPFYFDEYVHDLQSAPGMFEMLNQWGFGMAIISLLSLSLCAFWRARSPVGPPEDPFRDTRSQAVDFVGSLAPLYDKALTPQQALALHYKHFLQSASAQSGLRGEALATKIRAMLSVSKSFHPNDEPALAGQTELTHADFQRLLHVLNDANRRLELAHRR